MEEVLRELAEVHGFEYHEDTPDEIEARKKKIVEDVRREYAERYRVMNSYATGRAIDTGRAADTGRAIDIGRAADTGRATDSGRATERKGDADG